MASHFKNVSQRFDKTDYQLTEIKADGLYRHYKFHDKNMPENCWFNITTWPYHLVISGDIGTYVFNRIEDMVHFFDGDGINPSYWAEKCTAQNTYFGGGVEEFDPEAASEAMSELYDEAVEHVKEEFVGEDQEERLEILAEIRNDDYPPMKHFEHDHEFYESWYHYAEYMYYVADEPPHVTRYTWRYLYCLFAINKACKMINEHESNK